MSRGHEVVAVSPVDKYVADLQILKCKFIPLPIQNSGVNPAQDLLLMWRFACIFAREKPDVFLGFTVKPNIYGSLAAYVNRVPVINNISGLGSVFIKNGWLAHMVRWLYRIALQNSTKIFFQNNDDRQLFIDDGIVKLELTDLLPGSGVNLNYFVPEALPSTFDKNHKFRFLLVARMLRDKGVYEFVEAAGLVLMEWPQAEFCLLGPLDSQNPSAISKEEMDLWTASGIIKYLGVSDDVRSELSASDCVVLPSYREGVPRALLEASAMARPIIATDVAGCREVIKDGENGYITEVRNAKALAKKMIKILSLSDKERIEMGLRGRKKMEIYFSEQIVISKYLEIINRIELG